MASFYGGLTEAAREYGLPVWLTVGRLNGASWLNVSSLSLGCLNYKLIIGEI